MEQYSFHYDYTQCMVMKMPLAYPEKDGKTSHVINNFEDALDMIRIMDAVTQGITKILYLVGWQYLGHDDKYPDFFQVNEALRRPQDPTAHESMLWLMHEAKKYHTIVSVHINFNDAYDNAPSFDRYVKAGALIRKKNGRPDPIERYNGRKCYKVSFKEEWESGLFRERFDRLLELLPLQEAGTVHVDNFQCYHNYHPDITIREMQEYRRKMIEYVTGKGIDITSEFTYREDERLPNHMIFGLPREHHPDAPLDTLGLIPVSWWCTRMRREEYVSIPPQLYGGGMYKDKRYANYLYGNMHGEEIFRDYHRPDGNWISRFIHDFATVQVPYRYLCRHERLAIEGHGKNERCVLSDGIVSYNRDRRITVNGETFKEGDNVFLPMDAEETQWIAYSAKGDSRPWPFPQGMSAVIYRIESSGNRFLERREHVNGSLFLTLAPGELLLVEAVEPRKTHAED